jgi:hypothetical protein
MLDVLNPITTFIFILSGAILIKFIINLVMSTLSNPPKKYVFNKYEPMFYVVLISYILTFLIYK